MKTKQVIIIRKDLGMRKGKMIAQGAHASMKAVLDQLDLNQGNEIATFVLDIDKNEALFEWLTGKFTKIVVGCDSEDELLELYEKAKKAQLNCALIQDSGATEFHGKPTYTALAIGPDDLEVIDKITGHLKLL
jgi:PTH2 family peptidyl-tRNA hydrolase